MSMIAADVGGSKTRLVYAEPEVSDKIVFEARLVSTDYASFADLLRDFIARLKRPTLALECLSLALPGVVEADIAKLTNLPWVISKAELAAQFGAERIVFINDFEAAAYGVAALQPADLVVLNPAPHRAGATRVVLGAGTGLGLAWLQTEQGQARAYSSEGGHIDFAPVNQQQIELLQFLLARYRDQDQDQNQGAGHVSYERLLSGPGLVNLYAFCSRQPDTDLDAAAVHAAAEKGDSAAQSALQLFVQIYGSYAGNIALLFKPAGGIYIAGGIAGKITRWMQTGDFIDAYQQKGRMRTLLKSFPVSIVTNQRVGVMGALEYAITKQQQADKNDY